MRSNGRESLYVEFPRYVFLSNSDSNPWILKRFDTLSHGRTHYTRDGRQISVWVFQYFSEKNPLLHSSVEVLVNMIQADVIDQEN